MKKIIIIVEILGLVFSSCSNYLEEENLSNETAESFYTTETGFESLVNANYAQLREIYGDEAFMFSSGTDLYAQGRTEEPPGLSQYTQLNASSGGVDHIYNTAYEAIQTANTALHYADLTEQSSTVSTRVGEIKYLRANAYFLLVQTYGGVGMVTEFIDSPVLEFDRNSAEEVYNLIITDLTDALNTVDTGDYTGRVNQRAVQHLLAKVYLTRGYESFGAPSDFDTAASFADAAIAGQGLNQSYEELWAPDNDLNEEVIFSVQYDGTSVSADPTALGNRQAGYFGPYLGGSEVAGDAPYRTYNLLPTEFALRLFTEDDTRWDATFMDEVYDRYFDYYDVGPDSGLAIKDFYEPQWFTPADSLAYVTSHDLTQDFQYHPFETIYAQVVSSDYQTIPVKKFDDPTAPFGEKTSTRDIILSRLGETYLIAAEAYFQAGDLATALARLNVVRARAGVPPADISDLDIDYILDERARELLGEYHRWFDLKRTGKLVERASLYNFLIEESNFDGANGEQKILRPIPQRALDLNLNNQFPQNPAYN